LSIAQVQVRLEHQHELPEGGSVARRHRGRGMCPAVFRPGGAYRFNDQRANRPLAGMFDGIGGMRLVAPNSTGMATSSRFTTSKVPAYQRRCAGRREEPSANPECCAPRWSRHAWKCRRRPVGGAARHAWMAALIGVKSSSRKGRTLQPSRSAGFWGSWLRRVTSIHSPAEALSTRGSIGTPGLSVPPGPRSPVRT